MVNIKAESKSKMCACFISILWDSFENETQKLFIISLLNSFKVKVSYIGIFNGVITNWFYILWFEFYLQSP